MHDVSVRVIAMTDPVCQWAVGSQARRDTTLAPNLAVMGNFILLSLRIIAHGK